MPRRFRSQELSFDMHQVLSTQSFSGNQTSSYSLSFAVDHLDAISVVILIQSPRPLSQSMTSLFVFDRFVHTHVVIICFASDTHSSLYVSRLARILLYVSRLAHILLSMFRDWHAFFLICFARILHHYQYGHAIGFHPTLRKMRLGLEDLSFHHYDHTYSVHP